MLESNVESGLSAGPSTPVVAHEFTVPGIASDTGRMYDPNTDVRRVNINPTKATLQNKRI
jgi:hypothetical protein